MKVPDALIDLLPEHATFQDVIIEAEKLLPEGLRERPWKITDHGTGIYKTQDELNAYLASYGNMHLSKLNYAFDKLRNVLRGREFANGVNIIDWGCGQGTATCAFLDYLADNAIRVGIKHVALVEVSDAARERARALVSRYPQVDANGIYSTGTKLEDVDASRVMGQANIPTVNFFSNILDVNAIDIGQVAKRVLEVNPAGGWVVCVGPCNAGCGRIDAFSNYFDNRRDEILEQKFEQPYVWRNRKQTCTFKLRIFCIEPVRATETGHHRRIRQVYPGCCLQSGFRLDAIRNLGVYEDREWRTLCAFDMYAPFDIGAHIYSDVRQGIDTDGILCVLNNAIIRGIPTCASPFVEDCFRMAFGGKADDVDAPVLDYTSTAENILSGEIETFPAIFVSNNQPPNFHDVHALDDERIQLLFSPIAIAHVEEALAETFMCNRIPLDVSEVSILVIERDVPCGAIAVSDFSQMLEKIVSLMADPGSRKAPAFKVDVFCSDRFASSKLHRCDIRGTRIVGKEALSARYNMVVDIAALEDITTSLYSGKSPVWTITPHRQASYDVEDVDVRCFRTTKNVQYRNCVEQLPTGEYVDIEDACESLRYFLRLFFRKREFRPGQTAILDHALCNRTVIGLLPTGGGKSITYQLPVMLQPGPAVVVDPLVSLIEDQIRGLKSAGIDACAKFRAGMDQDERKAIVQRLIRSNYKFAFMSPERLAIKEARNMFSQMWYVGVFFSYGVVDEVHCVSEWGHDFRSAYLHLGRNIHEYVRPWRQERNEEKFLPLIGLTATASFDVLADVERDLMGMSGVQLDDSAIVRYENTNRLELQYRVFDIGGDPDRRNSRRPNYVARMVLNQSSWLAELQRSENIRRIRENTIARENVQRNSARGQYLLTHNIDCELPDISDAESFCKQGGLVFCLTKGTRLPTGVPRIRESLQANLPNGEKIGEFYGGNDPHCLENHERFCRNELGIMVATKAFGLGVDKANIRYVVEVFQPDSPESFVQEAGRAGRDGRLALATILYAGDASDTGMAQWFLDQGFPGEEVEVGRVNDLLSGANLQQLNGGTLGVLCSLNSIFGAWSAGMSGKFLLKAGASEQSDGIMKRLVYRMCCLGVITDAETQYRQSGGHPVSDQILNIVVREPGAVFESLRQYLSRYYAVDRVQEEVQKARNWEGDSEVEKCLRYMTNFAYRNIAEKRKRAIEDMTAFCRIGINNKDWLAANEELKDYLYYYFNSKYARDGFQTPAGEPYSLKGESQDGKVAWAKLIYKYARVCDTGIDDSGLPVDNIKHLLGAARLLRRNNPMNAAMGVLACFCLAFLSLQRNPVMKDEMRRCYCEDGLLSYLTNGDGERKLTPTEFGAVCEKVDELISSKTALKQDAPELFEEMQTEVVLSAENIWLAELIELNTI